MLIKLNIYVKKKKKKKKKKSDFFYFVYLGVHIHHVQKPRY